jgi:cytochrome c biogenesis protein CcdA
MDPAVIAFAYGAGVLASVNPCGFVMLPGLVALQVTGAGADQGAVRGDAVLRGLGFGLSATAGFLVVFGVLGGAIAVGLHAIVGAFPAVGLLVGLGLVATGLWLAIARRPLPSGWLPRGPALGGPRAPFVFGLAYGLASLACTLPIFLAVIGGSLATAGVLGAIGPLLAYGVGMGSVLVLVALGVALATTVVQRALRRIMPWVEQLGALSLIAVGGYLTWYWIAVLVR